MVTIDSGIAFGFPDTWERFTEGSRCVFHTPRREEIVVTAHRVTGSSTEAERAAVLDSVFQNGLQSAGSVVSDTDLQVVKPLAEDTGVCALRCASVLAETKARDAFFGQAVIQYPQGVLLLTYEAPFVDGADRAFYDLLRSIHEN